MRRTTGNRSLTWALPVLAGLLVSAADLGAQAPDRSRPPDLGPPPALQIPPIRHLTLSNGLPVLLVEKHEVPLVQVNLIIMAGAIRDPAGKEGLASMTADLMDEGAGSLDALGLADAIDYLGANLSTGAGKHTSVIALNTPLSKLSQALAIMKDIALKPTFPQEELARITKQRLTILIQQHDEPGAIAATLFDRTLYGAGHPYGRATIGSESSLKNLKVRDLRRFHRSYYRANNATLVVVGDVTAESVLPLLEGTFGAWRKKKVRAIQWPDAASPTGRAIYLVDKPGAAQSEIRIGRIGVSRHSDDYFALVIMNTILGGSFTSRLNQNLREEHGYTYGARSSFSFRPMAGPFMASAAVQTDATGDALAEFFIELEGMQAPVGQEELTKAKNYVALRFPERFQTVSRVAGQLADLAVYGLPDATFNEYAGHIQAVTAAEVGQVAETYLDAQGMAVIVVGDRSLIEASIHSLDFGPVDLLTVVDVLGPIPELPASD